MRLCWTPEDGLHGDQGRRSRRPSSAATQQKVDRPTKRPEWVVEVLAMDSERGEVIRVTVTGDQPKVSQGQPVTFSELEAIPWANNGRNGVAYRAASIQPAAQNRAA